MAWAVRHLERVQQPQELLAQLPALLRPGFGVDEHQDGLGSCWDCACGREGTSIDTQGAYGAALHQVTKHYGVTFTAFSCASTTASS